jgi:hypothetical protein
MPLGLNPDQSGQAIALMVLTPIAPGREEDLRAYLEGLRVPDSPLARLPRTHFGRWVIVPRFVSDPSQPKEEPLGCQYLLFSATLDGPLDTWLDELCDRLVPEATEIWGRCVGCPEPASGPRLKAYLLHNRIRTGQFVAAYPDATVTRVKASLRVRERMIAFAVRAQGMAPAELKSAFDAEFGS